VVEGGVEPLVTAQREHWWSVVMIKRATKIFAATLASSIELDWVRNAVRSKGR
jgi:hypothetical protein